MQKGSRGRNNQGLLGIMHFLICQSFFRQLLFYFLLPTERLIDRPTFTREARVKGNETFYGACLKEFKDIYCGTLAGYTIKCKKERPLLCKYSPRIDFLLHACKSTPDDTMHMVIK